MTEAEALPVLHRQLAAALQQHVEGDFDGSLLLLKAAHTLAKKNDIDFKGVLESYPVHFAASCMLIGDEEGLDYLIKNHLAFISADNELGPLVMSLKDSIKPGFAAKVFRSGLVNSNEDLKKRLVNALLKTQDPAHIVDVVGNVFSAAKFAVDAGETDLAAAILKQIRGVDSDFSKELPDGFKPPPAYKP